MSSNINLLGHKNYETITPASAKLKLLRAIAMVLLFGVSSASVILYILISFSALPQAQQQEQQALRTLAAAHPEMTKIALIEDRLSSISKILSSRSKYDVFLDTLVSKMPPGVTIEQVSIKENYATITVNSESLETLNIFVDTLIASTGKDKEYKQVILNNITSTDLNTIFSLAVSFVL